MATGRGGEGPGRTRARSLLVITEVALALVLTVGGALLVRSYRALTSTNLGFEEKGILTARVGLSEVGYASWPARVGGSRSTSASAGGASGCLSSGRR